jgi:type I restriction enzyme, S subunit
LKSKQILEFKKSNIGKIPANWDVKKLCEIMTTTLRHGIYKSKEFVNPNGVKILKMGTLDSTNWIGEQNMERFSINDEELKRHRIYEGNIIFARTSMMTGGLGNCGIVMKHSEPVIFDGNLLCAELNTDLILPIFCLYYFKSHYGQNEISRMTGGTQSRSIPSSELSNVHVLLPSKSEQSKISKILFDLDFQIENLQKQNKTLTQIPQLIYKSWFVNYDGHVEFKDSELGQIPKKWKVEKLANFLELTKGVSYKSKELMTSNKALVTLKSINRGGGYSERGLKSFNGKFNENQIVLQDDIIIAQTDLTQNAEVIGKPALIRNSKDFDILIASLDLLIVRPKNENISKSYLYHLFMTDEFQNHIYGYTSGTTVLHLAKDGVPNYHFVLPSKDILEKFDKSILSIMKKNRDNNYQIHSLKKTRDILLPKLMSGEIRV